MTVLVTEAGFGPDDWVGPLLGPDDLTNDAPDGPLAVDFPNDRDPGELAPWLDRLALVRVERSHSGGVGCPLLSLRQPYGSHARVAP
jgi:hypothetical protein